MANVPKPLLGLLLSAVAFFAVWTVALKGNSSSGGGSPTGVGQYQSAINQAHQAARTSDAANAALGAPVTTAPSTSNSHLATSAQNTLSAATAHTTVSHPAQGPAAKSEASASAGNQVRLLESALSAHKVVALLFYNPAAADDLAVKQELTAAAAPKGKVVKVAVPVSELSRFSAISNQVPVTIAPTLLIIDRAGQAASLTGFADRFEIAQRIQGALAAQ
jgi:hypothetical protein